MSFACRLPDTCRALVGRMRDEQDAAEVQETVDMAASFTEAWKQRRAEGA